MLAAVERGGEELSFMAYVSGELQHDRDFTLDAIRKNADVLKYICSRPVLLGDAGFMLDAVERNADATRYLSLKLQVKDGLCSM
ncbi:MAG: DUF4116 domain-containing protein [Gammaproteobacteria bacterium]|nr:DUF4116 domain-containing protein [Gammaproteobacteria bacterium]MCH9717920.1 DUF4116 domain-containing protein [Gammaproteobacteria bacterium]MCH9764146.1 DUF4116 domain-containing protein [Gammaproteobacteria bacterium]